MERGHHYSGRILIPYGLWEHQLTLDSISRDPHPVDFRDLMYWLANQSDEVVERVTRAATLLFADKAGRYEQCLETAIVWETG